MKQLNRIVFSIGFPFILLLLSGCFNGNFAVNDNFLPSLSPANKVLSCKPSDKRNPLSSQTKRITHEQLVYSIRDLFSHYLTSSEVGNLLNDASDEIANLPEEHHEEMNLYDRSLTQTHIEKYMELSESLADFVISNPALLTKVAGGCSSDASDYTCTTSFIRSFGKRAFRRPLSDEQVNFFLNAYQARESEGYRNLIVLILSSPSFTQLVEFGDGSIPDQDGFVRLSDYEIASKLSYFYLRSLPDDELLQAAQNGELSTQQGVKKQVDRLLSLPKVRQRLTMAFANQWLKLDETPSINDSTEAMKDILLGFNHGLSYSQQRTNLIQEVYDYFDYLIWEQHADFNELMTSNLVFPRTDDLAEIYNTEKWNGSYELNSLIEAPIGERAGLLTQAHFLFTGLESTRPIMRGVHVYKRFMCGELPSPADNNTPQGVVLEDHFTERERTKAITEQPDSTCVQCHKTVINPIGFAFENFDSFGRFRSQAHVYHPEGSGSAGEVLITKPIDSQTQATLPYGESTSFDNGVDLARNVASNIQAEACFAKTVWKFATAENSKFGEDDCAPLELFEAGRLESQGSIFEIFRSVALQPEFVKKKVE